MNVRPHRPLPHVRQETLTDFVRRVNNAPRQSSVHRTSHVWQATLDLASHIGFCGATLAVSDCRADSAGEYFASVDVWYCGEHMSAYIACTDAYATNVARDALAFIRQCIVRVGDTSPNVAAYAWNVSYVFAAFAASDDDEWTDERIHA